RALGQILSEGLVDLDLIKREHEQLAQGRISRSKVVECDRDAEILELTQHRQTLGGGFDKRRFRYLEFKPFGRQAGLCKRANNDVEQIVLSELNGGQIDRHFDANRPT